MTFFRRVPTLFSYKTNRSRKKRSVHPTPHRQVVVENLECQEDEG